MKVLVTGATGFIGRPLCAELLRLGHQVTALSRDAQRAQATLGNAIQCLTWGEGQTAAWKEAVADTDAVIHLAGESVVSKHWTPEVKKELMQSRVNTTTTLVDAMREAPRRPAIFVCASGINYYGERGDESLTEESAPGTTFLSEVTVAWEAEARKAEPLGVRVVRHRIGVVLGKGGPLHRMLYPLPFPISPWKLGLGGPLGSGRQWMPWIHLQDVIGMMIWAAENSQVQGAVITTAPQLLQNAEFSRALGRALRRPAIFPIPGFLLKALIGGFAEELLTGQKAVPVVAQKLGYVYQYGDIDSALKSILA